MRISKQLTLVTLLTGLAACDFTSGPRMTQVSVWLTDSPGPEIIQSAQVSIGRVYLVGSNGTTFDIATDAGDFDLLDLQNGVKTSLGSTVVEEGDYDQLRLVVTGATVTLKDGFTFSDGTSTRDLKVPSGPQTGIKVVFAGPVHITGTVADLVVDFPVDQSFSFVFTGGSQHPDGVIFKPVLLGTVTQ